MLQRLGGLCLVAVVGLTFAMEFGAPDTLTWVSGGLYLTYLVLLWRSISRSAHVLILVGLGLCIFGLFSGNLGADALRRALGISSFMAALFTCFGTLREAASSSHLVRRCGWFLASRPPGQRYGALTAGSHLFGLILNFSAIPLLGTLVLEGTRAADDPDEDPEKARVASVRRFRMAQAIHRGFITTTVWSPLSICVVVTFAALPQTSWSKTLPWLLVVTGSFMLIGWLLDRFSTIRRKTAPMPKKDGDLPDGSWWLLGVIALIVIGTFAAGWVAEEAFHIRLVLGVMMVCPFISMAWLLTQYFPAFGLNGALKETAKRAGNHVHQAIPGYVSELGIIGASTIIASVVGAMLPEDFVPLILSHLGLAPLALLMLIPWLAVVLGQLGMSPLLSVALIAATMPAPMALGLPPEAMAVAYAGAWSIVTATSPYTAALLISASIASSKTRPVTPIPFGLKANGAYTLLCLLALDALIVFLTLSEITV